MAEYDVSWSFAAFQKVGKDLPTTNHRILEELDEITNVASGWFFHMTEINDGWLMCNGVPEEGRWKITVREAHYADPQMPEALDTPNNKRFATYEAILAEVKKQKPSRLRTILSKIGLPLSRE